MNKIVAGCLIAAGILVPLGLISGAVQAINNYDAYQIISTPRAEVKTTDIGSNQVKVEFSIDRSNMVINSNSSETEQTYKKPNYNEQFVGTQYTYTFYGANDEIILSGEVDYDVTIETPANPTKTSDTGKALTFAGWYTEKDGGLKVNEFIIRENLSFYPKFIDESTSTKYDYMDNYLIWLIDMDLYNADLKNISGSETISVLSYKDREIEIRNDTILIDDVEIKNKLSIEHKDAYLYTGDTIFQEEKTYYEKKNGEYVEYDFKPGTSIEKGVYYEKTQNTTFSFIIDKLYRRHGYAVGIQFYYSVNDKNSTLYNKNLQERTEFTTKE